MKKLLTACILIASTVCSHAQTIGFCASVESDGYCNFNNTKFFAAQDSATTKIFMEIKSDHALGAASLDYKIYTVDKAGAEKLVNTITQTIQPGWMFAWAPYNFEPGFTYKVRIYNDAAQLLAVRSFQLFNWKS